MPDPRLHKRATADPPVALTPPGVERLVGRVLGDFTVGEPLEAASGVFLATQRSLGREAVLKVLPAAQPSEAFERRFLREAQLAARFDHPYAAHIYAFGAEPDGLRWIAMERVRGTPLDVFIAERGAMPPQRFAPFVQRLAEVIDAAHEMGIIHRDIKPANVMVLARAGALFPKLLDFGVAALLGGSGDDEARPATSRRVVGSPHYMAPERWSRPDDPQPSGDLYALGVLSFEALTGRVPFDAPSLAALEDAHTSAPPPPLELAASAATSGPLDAVLARALAKDAGARFPTAQAFAAALHDVAVTPANPLPQLDGGLRDAMLLRAPRPIAEAVGELASALHPHQALDALWAVVLVTVRLAGLFALAARLAAPAGRRADDAVVRELLRALRRRALVDNEWLALAAGLVKPFADVRDAHAVPELIDLVAAAGPIATLLRARPASTPPDEARALHVYTHLLPQLAELLAGLRFLEHLQLVVGRDGAAWSWMGIRRGRAAAPVEVTPPLADGDVALVGPDGLRLLELAPLLRAERPLPAAEPELFLLEGGEGGEGAARLVAPREGFAITDPALWERLGAALALDDDTPEDVGASREQAPYLGLAAFSANEASVFVGREREVETFLNRLRVQAFIGVVGPSGAGKSSFVGAGVIPALPANWRAVTVRPGPAPLDALATRLAREGLTDGDLRAALADDPEALVACLRKNAVAGPIVLVVDQFEELFTLCGDPAERRRYADTLARVARSVDEPLRVVVTLRDDYLVRVEQLPGLRDRLAQGFHLLATPPPRELRRILVEPAAHAGYDFDDPKLPDEMVADVAHRPGALALLSFAGLCLWEKRDRYFRRLTRRAYAEMGGVGGALAGHAEAMLALMTPAEQELVRESFRRLVTSEGTRAVVQRAEIIHVLGGDATADRVIERLVSARLLVASDADFGGDQLEVIHEALLTAWPRLAEWRRDDAEGARLREQLGIAAQGWERRGRPHGLLWREDALAEYRAWRTRYPAPLAVLEEEFARASLDAEKRSGRVRRAVVGGVLAALASGLFLVTLSERRADRNAEQAELQVALLHQEKGREALFAGDPMRAVVHLAEALRRGRDGKVLRYPLARASQSLSAQLLTLEHGARIVDAVFSKDGTRLVTGGDDGLVKVWDAAGGRLIHTLRGHGDAIAAVAVSPDGTLIASGSADGSARLWDLRTGELRRHIEGVGDEVRVLAFTPDGVDLVMATRDGAVRVEDLAGRRPPRMARTPALTLWSGEITRDGRRFVTATSDRTARVWDVATAREELLLSGHADRVMWATFSDDGRWVATVGYDLRLRVWDAVTGELRQAFPATTQVDYKVVFFPGGERIATAGGDKVIHVWRVADGTLENTLVGHTSYMNALAISPDGGLIASGSDDGTARLWDGRTGTPIATLVGHVDAVWAVHFDDTGRRLVTAARDGVAMVWDARRVDGLVLRGHLDAAQWAAFSEDGKHVLTTGNDRTARVWDAQSGENLATVELTWTDRHYQSTGFSRDGRRVLVCDRSEARIVDTGGGPTLTLRGHRLAVVHAVWSDDGTRVVTASQDGSARLWDAHSGAQLASYGYREVWGGAVAISGDNGRVATQLGDNEIQIIDVATGAVVTRITGTHLGSHSLQFSPDGQRLLSAGQDKTAKVWNLVTGRLELSLEGHQSDIFAARWSRDGATIVTAAADGVAAVWDAAKGERLLAFATPLALNWAELSPDGKRLVVAGDDHVVRVWPLEPDRRSAAAVAEFARCHSPFRLEGAKVVRAAIDRNSCGPDR